MDIYIKKQRWKFILIAAALFIGVISLFVTNILVEELENEEREKATLIAKAIDYQINNNTPDPFVSKIIQDNNSIPVMLVDEKNQILLNRNFQVYTKIDSLFISIGIIKPKSISDSFLEKELSKMQYNGYEPIQINLPSGDKQWVYYKDSRMLNRLRFYPLYQLGFITIFILIAYFIFNSSRRSEQNQVWAGMAKEAAHQLGTPISSLMAWIELLKNKKTDSELVNKMEKDIYHLETITNRFSKIGSQPELEETNIYTLVNEAIIYLESRFPKKIKINFLNSDKNLITSANKVLLNWVIENICKNSVDAMKGSGEILIELNSNKSHIIINISDQGEGINPSIAKNIFKPGVTSKKRGWGLGLSLSKRIIEEYHKGKIAVAKSVKGEGTTFLIKLPKK
jgi:two-component sensor histidine kinase